MKRFVFDCVYRPITFVFFGLVAPSIFAAAVTDGSVGAVQTLSGNFTIPQTLGTISGTNLFHSFRSFNVNTGESATFTTSSALQNVITRVTGGARSDIYGALRLDAASGSQPDFFFINPAGVTFGFGASVDVPAGFHVSTAHYLKFADGNFYADLSRGSALSAAAPEAFGFLGGGTTPAAVRFFKRDEQDAEGSDRLRLTLKRGSTFEVAAGAIDVDGGVLSAPEGTIKLAAIGTDPAEISLTSLSMEPLGGAIDLANGGISTVGNGGGVIVVRGGDITITNGGQVYSENTGAADPFQSTAITVQANNFVIDGSANSDLFTNIASYAGSSGKAGNIDVNVRDHLALRNGGRISSQPYFYANGRGGDISVQAGRMTIDSGSSADLTGVFTDTSGAELWGTLFYGEGDAGNIDVRVRGQINILDEGIISSSTNLSFGDAGNVSITAGGLMIDSMPQPTIEESAGGINSESRSLAPFISPPLGLGKGGDISVQVPGGDILLLGAGSISSVSNSGNQAGNIDIVARQITIDSRGAYRRGGINSSILDGAGRSGKISIRTEDALEVLNGGTISSGTSGSGDAGNILVNAGRLKIDFSDTSSAYTEPGLIATAIWSETTGTGQAGDIAINVAGAVEITGGGRISTSTLGAGNAGAVTLSGRTIMIAGAADQVTGIEAFANDESSGQAGNITVTASDTLALANDGHISIRNAATVDNPSDKVPTAISINANSVLMNDAVITASSSGNVAAGNIAISYSDRMVVDPSAITTSAVNGNGGSITIGGGGPLALDHSRITTSVTGRTNGNGGDINISAPVLALNTGFIQANTAASAASGGNVNINADAVLSSANTLFVGGTPLAFDSRRFGYNVIQAAAPDGVNGVIQISSPQIDLSGSLSSLSTQLIDFGALGIDLCRAGTGSSLTPVGRGGMPQNSSGWSRP